MHAASGRTHAAGQRPAGRIRQGASDWAHPAGRIGQGVRTRITATAARAALPRSAACSLRAAVRRLAESVAVPPPAPALKTTAGPPAARFLGFCPNCSFMWTFAQCTFSILRRSARMEDELRKVGDWSK